MIPMIPLFAAMLAMPLGGDDADRSQPACHSMGEPTMDIDPGDRKGLLLKQLHERLKASKAPFFGEAEIGELQELLAKIPPTTPPMQIINLKMRLAEDLLQDGQIERSIGLYEDVIRMLREQRS